LPGVCRFLLGRLLSDLLLHCSPHIIDLNLGSCQAEVELQLHHLHSHQGAMASETPSSHHHLAQRSQKGTGHLTIHFLDRARIFDIKMHLMNQHNICGVQGLFRLCVFQKTAFTWLHALRFTGRSGYKHGTSIVRSSSDASLIFEAGRFLPRLPILRFEP
jgi:hypothetical protein